MGMCRWEWFDFRRLPFEDGFLKETSRSRSSSKRKQEETGGNRRKQEEKVAKIAFAAGSGSILGDCPPTPADARGSAPAKIILFYKLQKLH